MQVRYDEERKIYRDCKWCGGRGCTACPGEAKKAYEKAFPNGPEPIATFKIPEEMDLVKEAIGMDVLKKFYGEDGEGHDAFIKHIMDIRKSEPKP